MKKRIILALSLFISLFSISQESGLFLQVSKKGHYYFENAKGKKVIKEKFTSASWFSEGLAVATTDFKYGVIDTLGNWIIPQEYFDLGDFHEGLAWFKKSKKK